MNSGKKINVNISSLVGLKAELLRKHTEIEDAEAKRDPDQLKQPQVKIKPKKVKKKKEKKVKEPTTTEIEDINELKKSKYMLEAKSRLYDKLKKSHGDEDHHYLVDFQNKHEESDDEIYNDDDYDDRNSDPEEDWVDYQDCFGRSRKCLRRDLPKMREKDNLIKQEITKKPPEVMQDRPQAPPIFVPPPKEPEIEIMRRKWEEQEEKLMHKTDIHYQDILFDEARDHGVGYYAFSHDEDERRKQQANLAKLRKETEERQKQLQEMNETKVRMEQNRLKIARMRQRVRAGLPAEPEEDEKEEPALTEKDKSTPAESAELETEKHTEKKSNDEDSLTVIEDKIKAFGELLGKRPQWRELTQEEWVQKRRKDRHGEFAPVYDNFRSGGHLKASKDNQLLRRNDDDDNDPMRIPTCGPEPTDLWESTGPSYDNDDADDENESKKLQLTTESRLLNTDIKSNTPQPNSTESSPLIPAVPPPFFDSSIPPPNMYNLPSHSSVISTSQSGQMASTTQQESKVSGNKSTDSGSESDSDDSDIIGPMPPVTVINDEALSQIPLPAESLDEQPNNLNIDKITAGLKFLRKKFEINPDS